MVDPILPGANVDIVGKDGKVTQPWYLFFRRIERSLQPDSGGAMSAALAAVQTTATQAAEAVATVSVTVAAVEASQQAIEESIVDLNDRVTTLEP